MKLITELNEDLEIIELEEAEGKKSLYIEGVFLQSETVNRNKRTYPREILEREIRRSGDDFVGKAKILKATPNGKIVEGLLKEGAKLGVSSRGMGTLKEQADGTKLVSDDFHLATAADIVADPSAPNAFVQGIMEGREWVWDNGALQEQDLEVLKMQVDVSKKKREETAILAFEKFLNSLKI